MTRFPNPNCNSTARLRLMAGILSLLVISIANGASVQISEFMASNSTTLFDEDGDSSDWIELWNSSGLWVGLSGWRLSDDEDDLNKWALPDLIMRPGQRLIVFASGKNRNLATGQLHANFKLSADGEYLALVDAAGVVVSAFAPSYPPQTEDVSYGPADAPRFYLIPTPGTVEAEGSLGSLAPLEFATGRGFFDQPFIESVTCPTPGATLVYTTDGSEPGAGNGTAITAPDTDSSTTALIPIETTTIIRAAAFLEGWESLDSDSHTYLFLNDVVRQDGSGLPPYAAWGDQDQPDWEMNPVIVDDPVSGATLQEDLRSIPTVSIAMDWDHLFASPRGIYIKGESDPRACSMEFFVHDGAEPGFQINASVQIQGGSSTRRWKVDKLSMRVKFTSDFGPSKLEYPLYAGSPVDQFDTLVLGAGFNHTWHHPSINNQERAGIIRDQLVADLQLDLSGPGASHHGRFVHVYLNGLYWGIYGLHERPDHSFAAEYFGGDKDDYDVLKHDQYDIVNGGADAYRALLALTRSLNDFPARYAAVEEQIDLPWLMDYLILNHWAGNYDWAFKNWYATRRGGDDEGPWRFHSWDAEHVMYDLQHRAIDENDRVYVFGDYLTDDTGSPVELHYNLMANAKYRLAFADRIVRHLGDGGILAPDHVLVRFEALVDEVADAVNGEAARWGDTNQKSSGQSYDSGDWTKEIEWLREVYIPARTGIVLEQYRDKGWLPDVAGVQISPAGGFVSAGSEILLGADDTATIYLTTDGSDPRLDGGAVNPASLSLPPGSTYTISEEVTIRARALSATGVWSVITAVSFQFFNQADQSNLLISEIHYHPRDPSLQESDDLPGVESEDFEFVEVFNTDLTQTIGLSGLILDGGVSFEAPEGTVLGPGERAVVVKNEEAFHLRYGELTPPPKVLGTYSGRLDNGGETISVTRPDGGSIATVNYSDDPPWPIGADGEGRSLVFDAMVPSQIPGDASAWRASTAIDGTPGFRDWRDFEDWAKSGGVFGSANEDEDDDGWSNLLEYALAIDPISDRGVASIPSVRLESAPLSSGGSGTFVLRWGRPLIAEDVNISVMVSSDLQNWSPVIDLDHTDATGSVRLETASLEVVLQSQNGTGESSRYCRLNAVRPESAEGESPPTR